MGPTPIEIALLGLLLHTGCDAPTGLNVIAAIRRGQFADEGHLVYVRTNKTHAVFSLNEQEWALAESLFEENLRRGTFGPANPDAWVWLPGNVSALPGVGKRNLYAGSVALDLAGGDHERTFDETEGIIWLLESGENPYAWERDRYLPGHIWHTQHKRMCIDATALGLWDAARAVWYMNAEEPKASAARKVAERNRYTQLALLYLSSPSLYEHGREIAVAAVEAYQLAADGVAKLQRIADGLDPAGRGMTGAEQLRSAVRWIDHQPESFNDRFNADELLSLWRYERRHPDLSLYAHEWSAEHLRAALPSLVYLSPERLERK